MPLLDGWIPGDIATEASAHAARVGDHTAAGALARLAGEFKRTQMPNRDRYDLLRRTLRQHGYDGAVYVNTVEDAGSLSFITFSRLNVKLAEPSEALGALRGTFGSTNPALAHGVGAGVGVPTAIAMREKAREEEKE